MIWNSIWIMTLIDLLLIGGASAACWWAYKKKQVLVELNALPPLLLMLAGLGVFALFYLADLFTMFVLPLFMPMMRAMEIMKELHLNYSWIISLVGVGCLIGGFIYLVRTLFPRITSILTANKEMTSSLNNALSTAQAASRAKSKFLANMSHELRTPLNAIIGFSDLLELDEKLSKGQLDQVKEIHHAGNHLYSIIGELLDLAKIESGRLDLKLESVDLQSIVKECLALVSPIGQQHEITISSVDDSCCRLVNVCADRTRLKQVVLNLLSNAIKYNHKGGSVSAECRQTSDDKVRLSIIDAGIGIPKERLAEIFAPFNRLGAELGAVEGTGIGLSISKQLVEMMGGSIGVESEPGIGSTFWMELPAG